MPESTNKHSDLQQLDTLFRVALERKACPDTDTLLRYSYQLLDFEMLEEVKTHTGGCFFCQQELSSLQAEVVLDTDTPLESMTRRYSEMGKRIWQTVALVSPSIRTPTLALRGDMPERFQKRVDRFTVTWVVETAHQGNIRLEGQVIDETQRIWGGVAMLQSADRAEVKTNINKYGHFVLHTSVVGGGFLTLELAEDVIRIAL